MSVPERLADPGVPLRLLLLADTHVPRRARRLPPEVWAAVADADVVVHAGDWVDVTLLDALEERSTHLLACYGNNDGPALRDRLPLVARATLAGVRVEVVHETGDRQGRERRCDAAHPAADLLVFGHSHVPWDSTSSRGLRLLNPGSSTDRRRQPRCTFMRARLAGGRVEDVTLHELPLPQERTAQERTAQERTAQERTHPGALTRAPGCGGQPTRSRELGSTDR